MPKNFTPFFTKLGNFKLDPAVSLLSSIFILSIVVVGFNQFSKQLASANCTTSSDLNSMLSTKSSLEAELASIDTEITDNNNQIVSLQSSLIATNTEISNITSSMNYTGDYYISQLKKTLDARYAQYLKYKNKKVKSRTDVTLEANYKKTYENTLAQYDSAVATNNANKEKLISLTNDKTVIETQIVGADTKTVELNTSRASKQTELDTLNASIESAYNNMCPDTETSCTNLEDDDKDGAVDCSDTDCSGDPACQTNTCSRTEQDSDGDCSTDSHWLGSACSDGNDNDNDGNIDCSDGDCSYDMICSKKDDTTNGTVVGGCNTNSDCSSGTICSAGACITDSTTTVTGYCTSDAECSSNQTCSSGSCVEKQVDTINEVTCNDASACNNGGIGACDYTSCHNTTTDSCTDEYDEMGWKIRLGWGGVRITNEDETNGCGSDGDHSCDPDWTAYDWAPDLHDRTAGYTYWGCETYQMNCSSGKIETKHRKVTGCSYFKGE